MTVKPSSAESTADPTSERYAAPALDKGLDILELLSEKDVGLTQRQVADALGKTASEIFRMLNCLEARGYIMRSKPDDLYHLSSKMFVLAHRHPPAHRLLEAAMPILRQLAMQTSQSCHLGVYHNGELLVLGEAEAPGFMGFVVRPGTCMPLHLSSSGAVLLAFQPDEVRRDWLKASRLKPTVQESKSLEKRLALILKQGYAQQSSQTIKGITDIAVPVFDHQRHAAATVTVPFLAMVHNAMPMTDVRSLTLEAASELSRHLCGN